MKRKDKPLRKIRYRLVFNRSGRLNARGEGLIQIECAQSGRRVYFSTNTYVRPSQWGCGMCVDKNDEGWASGMNYALFHMVQQIERVELEFIKRGTAVTLSMLKEAVKESLSPAARLRDFGINVIAGSDRKDLTKANYKTLFNNLDKFRPHLLITDIDYPFIVAYDRWLREQNISHNTRVSRLRLLRSIMNEALRRDIIDSNPFDRFRIQQMVSKKGFLTFAQIKALEGVKLDGKPAKVRDSFLLACYTGLRFSDIISLRSEHIKEGWIHKTMVKTGLSVDIPIDALWGGKSVALIAKYGKVENLVMNLGGNAVANKILRSILDGLDISPTITFHSSRHTFATLLGQKGVPIQTIQKLLGHTKVTTTQIYTETDRNTILNDIRI